jgi:hypothetical protein
LSRCYSNSGQTLAQLNCPLSANSGHDARRRKRRLRKNAPAKYWSVKRVSEVVRDDIGLFAFGKLAGQGLSGCELYSATVWEFDIAPDELAVTLKYVFRANWIAHCFAR